MTERRPHWDAELCNAVYDAALEAYKDGLNGGAYDIFPIIAAVEDWMDANDNPLPHVLNECLQWLDAERAAIARVRELHKGSPECAHCAGVKQESELVDTCDECCEVMPCPTIRALDGEQ